VLALTTLLDSSVGGEVLGNQDTDLNTRTMDTPISDARFLLRTIAAIAALPTVPAQHAALHVQHPDEINLSLLPSLDSA